EHEYDHVFLGITDNIPVINTAEVENWEAISYDDLHDDIQKNPSDYTYWFRMIYENVNQHIMKINNERS
ncbi:MAG: isopentenyl-diphosphate delta-isomerase, partial [Bacteroidetes bacterium]|nr:isopentenyl-diphosphate delta-isomerase [Bacteroidota bacterium]